MKYILFLFLVLSLCKSAPAQVKNSDADCKVCQRIALFDKIRKTIGNKYWPGFAAKELTVPLIYFSDSTSYIAYSEQMPFKDSPFTQISCGDKQILLKMAKRLDNIPFHMENQMTLNDSTSPLYFRPMMFCSDVETLIQKVPDFKTTEEWIQLVIHEYFHSYQFSHYKNLHYFAEKIKVQEDSLTRLYQKYEWFSNDLKEENSLLLSAINTTYPDSLKFYVKAFLKLRASRRNKFKEVLNYDISAAENFWEKMEGTARYVERYTAAAFSQYSGQQPNNCDPLFNDFAKYKNKTDLRSDPNFIIQSRIMPKYYYVTGFNMCRLLDKLHVNYKPKLFELSLNNLTEVLQKKIRLSN